MESEKGSKGVPYSEKKGRDPCGTRPLLLPTNLYQFTRTPNRITRGATMAWIWLAFDAFWRLRIAWTVFELATLNTSSDGTKFRFITRTARSTWKSTLWKFGRRVSPTGFSSTSTWPAPLGRLGVCTVISCGYP